MKQNERYNGVRVLLKYSAQAAAKNYVAEKRTEKKS